LSRAITIFLAALAVPATTLAHFIIFLPGRPAARARDPVSGTIHFGHPFEHELLDMVEPESLRVTTPGGEVKDLTSLLISGKAAGAAGRRVSCYRFQYVPRERGDHCLSFISRPRLDGEEGFLKDFVKVVLHVQAERGWERPAGHPLEIVPLTRPYGLRPGATFTARALLEGKSLEGALVEIERYSPEPPKTMPENEFITRTLRTGPGGLIATTLDEPGWWAISLVKDHGTLRRDGKEHPLTLRATFWLYVGEPLKAAR